MSGYPTLQQHRISRVTASGAVSGSPALVFAYKLVAGSAAATSSLTNDATGAGDPLDQLAAVTGSTEESDYSDRGPVTFDSKLYCVLAGTGAVAYVWWDG